MPPAPQSYLKKIVSLGEFILKNRGIAVAIAALLLVLFLGVFRQALVVLLLVAAASFSMFYGRFVPQVSLGVELVTLATVVTGLLHGGIMAALVGFVSLLAAETVGGRMTGTTIISLLGITATGLMVPLFSPWGITGAGIAAALFYDALIVPLYIATGSRIWNSLLYLVTHILFTIWIFFTVAPLVYRAAG